MPRIAPQRHGALTGSQETGTVDGARSMGESTDGRAILIGHCCESESYRKRDGGGYKTASVVP
jgi:hypothetical protein